MALVQLKKNTEIKSKHHPQMMIVSKSHLPSHHSYLIHDGNKSANPFFFIKEMHLFKANDQLLNVTWKSLSIQMSFVPLGQHAFQKQKKQRWYELLYFGLSPSNSQHQDYDISSRGSRTKPSFATVTGRGDNPSYSRKQTKKKITTR